MPPLWLASRRVSHNTFQSSTHFLNLPFVIGYLIIQSNYAPIQVLLTDGLLTTAPIPGALQIRQSCL